MHAMYRKHMWSLGCPFWADLPLHHDKAGGCVCETYIVLTDEGSDESLMKRMAEEDSVAIDKLLTLNVMVCVWKLACFMHIYHLIVKKSLKTGDLIAAALGKSMKYYSTIAKILHVWRDYSKTIHGLWARISTGAAKLYAFKRPPRAISGRWGTIDEGATISYDKFC